MLSVSSMALAAMLGSACGTNMANINDCNAALYNTGNCPHVYVYAFRGPKSPMLPRLLGMVG